MSTRISEDTRHVSPLPSRERKGPAKREGEGARAGIAVVAKRRRPPHPPVGEATGPSLSRKGRGRGNPPRTAGDLVAAGLVPESRRDEIDAVAREFSLAVTPDMADLIDPADPA